jgi:ubiquinone biosynthesis protein
MSSSTQPPPSGRAQRPRPTRHRRRGLFRSAIADFSRFGKISAVLARHGFGHLAWQMGLGGHASPPPERAAQDGPTGPDNTAQRFRAVLEDLGPTFVKLGQVLSTRPDLLPPAFIEELSRLQDHVPPMPFEVVEVELRRALHPRLPGEVFLSIDPHPLAAASIAQTHLATLPDGAQVVIKVQRPDLEALISSDLALLRALARMLEASIQEMSLYSPSAIVNEFERALLSELDFSRERQSLHTFRALYQANPSVWIPKPFDDLCAPTLLVMERIPGVKITDAPPNTPAAHALALRVIDLFYTMLFEHGVFHGDPHPGNVLLTPDDRIGLIDFGLVGTLSRRQQDTLVSLIISVVSGDIDGIARAVLSLGRAAQRIPMRAFRDDIIDIRARYLQGALSDIDLSAFVLELLEAGQRYRIQVPAEWALLTRATVSIEGIVRTLYADLDLPAALRPYARRLLLQRYGPERLSETLLGTALSASSLMREVPSHINQVLMDMEHGGLRVQLDNPSAADLRRALRDLAARLSLGLIACGLTVGLFISLQPLQDQTVWGLPLPAVVAGGLLLVVLSTLWLSVVFDGRDWRIRITPFLRRVRRR